MSANCLLEEILNQKIDLEQRTIIINHELIKETNFVPRNLETIVCIVDVVLLNEKNEICLIQEGRNYRQILSVH
jgi:hypothetical protein